MGCTKGLPTARETTVCFHNGMSSGQLHVHALRVTARVIHWHGLFRVIHSHVVVSSAARQVEPLACDSECRCCSGILKEIFDECRASERRWSSEDWIVIIDLWEVGNKTMVQHLFQYALHFTMSHDSREAVVGHDNHSQAAVVLRCNKVI